eukprot:CAMPEP_0194752902 /NCGR_PEP_ID=MMETSP0323_2-20130528/6806_1 /TAXON_ID=2866 ORGANISM="Crypthecodinium cohnii, Strain Seligo" /NCGR_SAMPLE_ID=MMETSP0323_2 /ASSEMBLY_ACC=CAM_ASM_000346 /LENGTH=102 /DNA_ID=CAMNT_0039670297 /DNA_START=791 /DNA_END=1096 /DNA_ORIENTATION=+
MAAGMKKSDLLRATGNAMTAPVVAAVVQRCFEDLSSMVQPRLSTSQQQRHWQAEEEGSSTIQSRLLWTASVPPRAAAKCRGSGSPQWWPTQEQANGFGPSAK